MNDDIYIAQHLTKNNLMPYFKESEVVRPSMIPDLIGEALVRTGTHAILGALLAGFVFQLKAF